VAPLPLVSVIVPVYNRADVLAETLDAVFAQTYPNLELIVVDDGSKDDTPKVVARYGDRLISVRQENQGLAAARNNGFLRSRGEYIAWLDHDDVWMPEKLSLQVAWMQQHPECAVVATDFSAFDAAGFYARSHAAAYYSQIARHGLGGLFPERALLSTRGLESLPAPPPALPATLPVHHGRVYDKMIWGNFLHPPTVMMRRAAALQAGFCEQRFGNDVDYEYLIRVSKQGEAAFIDYPLIRYRYSEGQLSSDKNLAKIARSLLAVLDDLALKEPALRRHPEFRRRAATAHLTAAHALADAERGPALRHLVASVAAARGIVDASATARTVAKLLLPNFLIDRIRQRSRSSR
jgi:glycosyltransferase involved in cell wall biosynthesis